MKKTCINCNGKGWILRYYAGSYSKETCLTCMGYGFHFVEQKKWYEFWK